MLSAIVGVVVGIVWEVLAPRPQLHVVNGELRADPYSLIYIDSDMILSCLCIGAGLLLVVIGLRWRRHSLGLLAGCLVGGLVGSTIAWRVGVQLSGGPESLTTFGHAEGSVFDGPIALHAYGTILLWPTVSCMVITIWFAYAASRARRRLLALADARADALVPVDPPSATSVGQ